MNFLAKLIAYKVARTCAAPLSTLLASSTARGISLTGTYTGTGLPAKVSAANNGTITSGIIEGV